jgi:hypothetical protein
MRQRVRAHDSPLTYLNRLILVLVCLAVLYYAVMLLMLALKVSPDVVNGISGYRPAFDFLDRLRPNEFPGGTARAIAALAGILAFGLFLALAMRELPRPYLARGDLALAEDHRGALTVEPRAIERAAEAAAVQNPAVSSAAGRYGGDAIELLVHVRRAHDVADTLRDVRDRAVTALGRHDLPPVAVNVTLAGFDREQRRELS